MPKIKRFFVDVETSGLDERVHGIVQISGMLTIDDKIVETFNEKPRLFTSDVFDPESTKAHGLTEEECRSKERTSASDVYISLSRLLSSVVDRYDKYDKLFFIAFNATFDDRFLRAFWSKNMDKYYGSFFWWAPIDIASIASHYLAQQRATLKNFKQSTVAQALGIEVDEARLHDSLYDIEIMQSIYNKLTVPPRFLQTT